MIKQTIKNIQNPAIGAYLIWKTTEGYCSDGKSAIPLHALFLVMPLLLNKNLYTKICSTRSVSTLYKFISKLTPEEFVQIVTGVGYYKKITFNALGLAARTGLIKYDASGNIYPLKQKITPREEISKMGNQGVKLGHWFSQLSLSQIFRITMVK
jgi:hypothetical protein